MKSDHVATSVSDSPASRGLQAGQRDSEGSSVASPHHPSANARIMIVDDEPVNIKIARKYLSIAGYSDIISQGDSTQALAAIREQHPDVVLLDVMMPHVDGLTVLHGIRSTPDIAQIPVIILTANTDAETKQRALDLGATDFLLKPVDAMDLVPRVRNAVALKAYTDHLRRHSEALEHEVRQRTLELEASRNDVIVCLARAAEFRDDNTGQHIIRVGRFAGAIAKHLGFPEARARLIEQAAMLHDVGKIGIPDTILMKPGPLDPQEFYVVQSHCGYGKKILQPLSDDQRQRLRAHTEVGAKILEVSSSPVLALAAQIALTHHEKWDGSGYPLGLVGDAIPIESRITAVADVFDALSTRRPYKEAMRCDQCLEIMTGERGKHFDPEVFDAFIKGIRDIIQIQIEHANTE